VSSWSTKGHRYTGGGVGWAVTGLPLAEDEQAAMVARIERRQVEGAVLGEESMARRRRECGCFVGRW
jgi:hypothetical protein